MNPNPGSREALAQGCICAVLDNEHGRGCYTDEAGNPQFWISGGCPLHDPSELGDPTDDR